MSSARDLNVYDVSDEEGFDVQKLVYFGLSVFWRGAAHRWTTSAGQEAPEVQLCASQEPLRKFLLGKGRFPLELILLLDVWPFEDTKTIPGLLAPRPGDSPKCQVYWFLVPGLIYRLFIGRSIPLNARRLDARQGIVSVDRQLGLDILNYTKSQLQSADRGPRIQGMLESIAMLRSLKHDETD